MTAVRPLFLPTPYQDSAEHGRLILRDGSTATVRLAKPDDRELLRDFFRRLSPESRRMRFFSESKPGEDVIDPLCEANDPQKQLTLVVTRYAERSDRIIATGSYLAQDERSAEFAVAVEDSFQGRGIGALLLERLSVLAASNGFVHFTAVTHAGNKAMLEVFHGSGFQLKEQFEDGYVEVDFSVLPREESVLRSEARDRLFTKASIRPFFNPASVAVVGASRDPSSFGHRIMEALVMNRFNGPVYPVNPNAQVICSIKAHPSVRAIPEPVDLAVIAVPRDSVLDVVDDCADRGVRAIVVISAGFAEAGEEGAKLQARLVEKVRGYGMRMVGPNCLGVINTDPAMRLNASFSPSYPPAGRVALSSQSGALGLAILSLARQRNLGLSMFISMGNKADVTGNDLLHFWEDDPHTDVILLYLESFGNPRRFARIARHVSRSKPIICVKSGRAKTEGGAGDAAVDALFRQTGVLRADTLEEMFDLAALIGNQPLPPGPRVGILTNSHGAGVLCADTCAAGGLRAVVLSPETTARLTGALPAGSSFEGMVDMTASASPGDYRQAAEAMLTDPNVDGLIVLYIPIGQADTGALAAAVCEGVAKARAAGRKDRPVAAVMMTGEGASGILGAGGERIPRYLFPETAARAFCVAAEYWNWRIKPAGTLLDFEDVDTQAARDVCRRAIAGRGGGWLTDEEAHSVLDAFRLSIESRTTAGGTPRAVVDLMVTVREDPLFGPLIGLGLTGGYADILQDIAYRVTPLTGEDAADMVRDMRGHRLLDGRNNLPPADIPALQEILLRISLMVEEIPEIREIRLDPVRARTAGSGCAIGAARIRVEPSTEAQPARYTLASAE
jgi:acetate---CoA ligase (ADP-forming)